MRSYAEAIARLNGREGLRLEYATRLERRGEDVAVVLHSTDVVTYHTDGTITLRNGGWFSRVSRDRIENYAPVRIVGPLRRGCFDLGAPGMMGEHTRHEGGPWMVEPHAPNASAIEWHEAIRVDALGRPVDFTLS